MPYRTLLITAILLVFAGSLLAHSWLDGPKPSEATSPRRCRRIISMAPSVTETLYALGLGNRVVGVTRYCQYPPEVKNKTRVGGYFDPNFEAIVALRPDLVIMLEEQKESLPAFEKLNLRTLVLCHKTIDGIIESFRAVGQTCGKRAEGRQMADQYEARLQRIGHKMPALPRPRVLLVLDRTYGRGHLTDVCVAGVDGYFDRMIELAGGQNAYRQRGPRNPVISAEGILWLNPDVIVNFVFPEKSRQLTRKRIIADWDELAQVNAVNKGRVYVFDQPYACVPGPRFVQLAEDLAAAIHPEPK